MTLMAAMLVRAPRVSRMRVTACMIITRKRPVDG